MSRYIINQIGELESEGWSLARIGREIYGVSRNAISKFLLKHCDRKETKVVKYNYKKKGATNE